MFSCNYSCLAGIYCMWTGQGDCDSGGGVNGRRVWPNMINDEIKMILGLNLFVSCYLLSAIFHSVFLFPDLYSIE